ncbi:hypothetical protein GH714_010637 [Hevea brasiliensis]|uniref:Homeobox-leucine zipper protein n=1 Tax=Hevea brasiliensis TaxID=3981 RepID=A0A6A6M4H0_HEVBR|nr:hypothetical protein GH714_010637 [Hevea brasiliensis]
MGFCICPLETPARSKIINVEHGGYLQEETIFQLAGRLVRRRNYEEQLPEKKRRLTLEQVNLLEKSFQEENKLEPERKTQLAKKLGLQPRQVAVWFQNRRARWKTKQLERDYDLLKASYDSLLSNYDTAVKQNEKLKSEVVSLTEKLEAKDVTGALPQQNSDSLQVDIANACDVQMGVKVEDRLSSGSTRSAVVDEDSPQLLDSGDFSFRMITMEDV